MSRFLYIVCSKPCWLHWCSYHLNKVGVFLKGLTVGVCESSVHTRWNQPQDWKESCVLVVLVQEPFHVSTFLLFWYNCSSSIINKSSIPALTFFLQWVTTYSMIFFQIILHLSIPRSGACSGRLPAGWVCKRWDWSVPPIPAEAMGVQWLKLPMWPLLTRGAFSVMTAALFQKALVFKISFCLDESLEGFPEVEPLSLQTNGQGVCYKIKWLT